MEVMILSPDGIVGQRETMLGAILFYPLVGAWCGVEYDAIVHGHVPGHDDAACVERCYRRVVSSKPAILNP